MKLPAILFIAASSIAFTACDDVRVEKYPNGNVRFEATYVNDKKEGIEKEYYDDGTLKRESNYVNDRREGVTKEYYKDGTLQTELPYVNGYVEGTVVRYHKNGKVATKAEYKQNKQVAFGETTTKMAAPLQAEATRTRATEILTNGLSLATSSGLQKT